MDMPCHSRSGSKKRREGRGGAAAQILRGHRLGVRNECKESDAGLMDPQPCHRAYGQTKVRLSAQGQGGLKSGRRWL